jgi:hypothetical protein
VNQHTSPDLERKLQAGGLARHLITIRRCEHVAAYRYARKPDGQMRHDLLVLIMTGEFEPAKILLAAQNFSICRAYFEVRCHVGTIDAIARTPAHPDRLGIDNERLSRPEHTVRARLVDAEPFGPQR